MLEKKLKILQDTVELQEASLVSMGREIGEEAVGEEVLAADGHEEGVELDDPHVQVLHREPADPEHATHRRVELHRREEEISHSGWTPLCEASMAPTAAIHPSAEQRGRRRIGCRRDGCGDGSKI